MPLSPLTPLAKTFKSFFGRDTSILREALKAVRPEELGVIINNLTDAEQLQVLMLLEAGKLAKVLWEVSPHARDRLIDSLPADRFASMLAVLESDEAVDLIQLLDKRRKERVIEQLKKSDPKKILPLLGFAEKTAGGLMKTEFLRAESGKPAEEVRKLIAAVSGGLLKATTVYVTDASGTLLGTVSLMRLATAAPGMRVDELVHVKTETLQAGMPQEEVIHRFSDLEAIELPVVDVHGKLLGVITANDMLDVIKESLAEDLSRFSGTSEDEHITDPAWLSIRRRLPWLLVNLATAVLAAWVVAQFQDTIAKIVILAALMPIVAGMGGNAVTQTLGVVIRALALDHMHDWDLWKIAMRQTWVGAFNGFINGLVIAVLAFAWTRSVGIPLVLITAMVVNLLVAGAGGVLIPVAMKKMRIDPALASIVFATTLTDCVGFFAFLGLAKIFLT